MTNVADWIVKEHDEFRDMLDEIIEMNKDDQEEVKEAFTYMRKRFRGHGKGEEMVVFPLMLQNERTKDAALEALEWHRAVRPPIKEIMETEPAGGRVWVAKIKVIRRIMFDHLEAEERDAVALIRQVYDIEQLVSMGKDFRAVEDDQLKKVGISIGPRAKKSL